MPYADLRRLTRKVKTRLSKVGLNLRGPYGNLVVQASPNWTKLATTSGGSQPVAQFKFSLWAKFPSSSKLGQFAVQFPSLRLQPHVPAPCLRHLSQPICPALCPSLQSQPSVQVCPLSQPFVSALCPSPSAQLICHILVSQPSVPAICPSHPCLRLQTLVPALCLRLTLVPLSQPIRPAHCPSLLSQRPCDLVAL